MHDYKFRHNDLSFRPAVRRSRRAVGWLAASAILGVLIYAATQLDLTWGEKSPRGDTRSDVIPLSLPPTPGATGSELPPQSGRLPAAPVAAPIAEATASSASSWPRGST